MSHTRGRTVALVLSLFLSVASGVIPAAASAVVSPADTSTAVISPVLAEFARSSSGKESTPLAAARKAKKVAKPKFVKKRTKKMLTSPAMSLDLRYVELKGGTAKQRKAVNGAVKSRISSAKKFVADWRRGCYEPEQSFSGPASLKMKVLSAQIYQGRYASVLLDTDSDAGCGGVSHQKPYQVNIDLNTGKSVKIGTFVSNRPIVRSAASTSIYSALKKKDLCVWDEYSEKLLGLVDAWGVSKKGLTVAYGRYTIAEGACGTVAVTVPWKHLIKPAEIKGKSRTTVYVSGLKKEKVEGSSASFYSGVLVIVTQRGKAVVIESGLLHADSYTEVGKTSSRQSVWFAEGHSGLDSRSWKVKKGKVIPNFGADGLKFHKATKAELKIVRGEIGRKNLDRFK